MAKDSQPKDFFAGEFRHSMDEKNRITVPSKWRQTDEGENFILLPEGRDDCLIVLSPENFAKTSAAVEENPGVPPRDRRMFLRHLHSKAQHASCDKQGRLVLPDDLCKALQLKGEVALVGGRGRFEIWNTTKRAEVDKEEKAAYQRVSDMVGF